MTELRIEPYVIPGADIGPENPLPVFRAAQMDSTMDFEANEVPEEDRPGLGWQTGFRVLPYRMQDDYKRDRKPKEFFSVVLENEHLRVMVLPQIGGLVTEIIHRASGKQLIAKNNVFQPGNIALRNAWVYGGIEWNTAQLGHHYLTMEPLHTARIKGINGEPALRMYAWDRVKCFPYQIDLHLPEDSEFLFARIRIINPHDYTLPMYWWTNMGVDQREGRRVVAPAETAYKFARLEEVPIIEGIDHSYPLNIDHAYDLFFRIPQQRRKWLAVVDADGTGLLHTSTSRLVGRKMFAWGTGPGGRRWQEYLCGPGQEFSEVQAGLARTQTHSVPMPAGQQWAWTEAFGHLARPRMSGGPPRPGERLCGTAEFIGAMEPIPGLRVSLKPHDIMGIGRHNGVVRVGMNQNSAPVEYTREHGDSWPDDSFWTANDAGGSIYWGSPSGGYDVDPCIGLGGFIFKNSDANVVYVRDTSEGLWRHPRESGNPGGFQRPLDPRLRAGDMNTC